MGPHSLSASGGRAQARAAVLTSVQCAVYGGTKRWWMRATGMADGPATHLGASMLTGLATTTATTPVDVVKTNMFASAPRHASRVVVVVDGRRARRRGRNQHAFRCAPARLQWSQSIPCQHVKSVALQSAHAPCTSLDSQAPQAWNSPAASALREQSGCAQA